jgi:hypothetical protein
MNAELSERREMRGTPETHGTRREWLAGLLGLGLSALGADDAARKKAVGRPPDEKVRELLKSKGIKNIRSSQSVHYSAIGDAPDAFRDEALDVCEKLARTFQKHFHDKGFETVLPTQRMTIVTLARRASYAAVQGKPVAEDAGGHYDVDADLFFMFDFRPDNAAGGAELARLNTFTLVHEAMHQLTYDTDLLNRESDVPLAVSEGLATYGEGWRPKASPQIGLPNGPRLDVLRPLADAEWIRLAEIFATDKLFDEPKAEQVAYAESWLLFYHLLQTRSTLPKLKSYLRKLRNARDSSKRVELVERELGRLDRLEREMKATVRRLESAARRSPQ